MLSDAVQISTCEMHENLCMDESYTQMCCVGKVTCSVQIKEGANSEQQSLLSSPDHPLIQCLQTPRYISYTPNRILEPKCTNATGKTNRWENNWGIKYGAWSPFPHTDLRYAILGTSRYSRSANKLGPTAQEPQGPPSCGQLLQTGTSLPRSWHHCSMEPCLSVALGLPLHISED